MLAIGHFSIYNIAVEGINPDFKEKIKRDTRK